MLKNTDFITNFDFFIEQKKNHTYNKEELYI